MFSSEPPNVVNAREYVKSPPKGTPGSVTIPGTEKPGRSRIYRHWKVGNGKLLDTLDPNVHTIHELFDVVTKRQPNAPCLGSREWDPAAKKFSPYQWLDYQTVQKRSHAMGAGLVELHRRAGVNGEKFGIGLWCQNRPEWQITDLACVSQSLFSVSLYESLGPDATEFIIQNAELACVVTSLPHIPALLKLKPRLPSLKLIVCLDPLDGGEQAHLTKRALLSPLAADVDVSIHTLPEVEELGASLNRPCNPPSPEDIVTINYTSGTTGNPKGVVLTHRNAVAAAACSLANVIQYSSDISCSYLPLAHIYGRMVEQCLLWAGGRIGYFHGNILELVDDFKLLRPTILGSVPRLYSRFGAAIRSATVEQPGLKGALSRHVVDAKMANLTKVKPADATYKHALYDRIWTKKVAGALGFDRTRIMASGSAPLDQSLHQFLRVALGTNIVQGYGLTESYAIALCQYVDDLTSGHCGFISPSHEACLESLPDMEYSVEDKPHPRGELLLRGETLFKGYHKNPEETAKSITEDGWFRTGDVCRIDEHGRFIIIDRRKNLLKLAQGEYVSPERIEGIYQSACSYLGQIFVHGDSLKTSLVGILGIQPDTFATFASRILKKSISPTDLDAIRDAAGDEKIRQAVFKDLERVGRTHKLAGYEKVKSFALLLDPFTIENGLLTPTLKLKRPQVVKTYRQLLDELYAVPSEESSAPVRSKL